MTSIDGARVAFLQSNAINESMGLCDLAGHLKAGGVTTRLFLEREERRLGDRIVDFAPHLIVIPCDLMGHNTALRLAKKSKEAIDAPVVLGGTHPTFFPNVVLRPNVDYAFAGEAEGVVADLLAAVQSGLDPSEIPNLIVRNGETIKVNPIRPLVQNPDTMAFPDREIYFRYRFLSEFPWKKFNTGRGCLNACGYCFNPSYRAMLGNGSVFFRRKSPDRIIEEILRVKKNHRLGIVHFSDDLFSSGLEWLEPFAKEYGKKLNVPFSCNMFASAVDEPTVDLLKRAGCRTVAIGIETADETMRRELMNKPVRTETIERAAKAIKAAGIRLTTFNILGLPWSSVEKDMDTLELNQRLGTDHARATILVPFPKSALTRRLIRDGFLAEDFEERIYETKDLPNWPAEDLFKRSDPARTVRLLRLWPLMLRLRLSKKWMRRLVDSPLGELLSPFAFAFALLAEKRIFRIGWRDGFRFFLHVKSPALKTTNYVSFI
jgi:radical SAM superfamily enzyme YgiQ (UPF0313 family)